MLELAPGVVLNYRELRNGLVYTFVQAIVFSFRYTYAFVLKSQKIFHRSIGQRSLNVAFNRHGNSFSETGSRNKNWIDVGAPRDLASPWNRKSSFKLLDCGEDMSALASVNLRFLLKNVASIFFKHSARRGTLVLGNHVS